ncbi:hypothetical protein CRUP_032069 [Coryphaenoides rupestris]|nr:hypothetical protein CRUP_032069 [Coryphaenoides rupestris]
MPPIEMKATGRRRRRCGASVPCRRQGDFLLLLLLLLACLQPADGKTRTKDKYRVVYTDHQRLELEKEFHYSRYITIRRKAELATSLGLSERQGVTEDLTERDIGR